ncbi:amidohydrolase [Thermus sp. FJN-A]
MVKADFALVRARIYTLDPRMPRAEGLAAWRGRILALGSEDQLKDLIGPGTEVLEAGGRPVFPGFHDAHCHILLFGLSLLEVNLKGVVSLEQVRAAVADRARSLPAGRWIRGGGYNENLLAERRHPTRWELDAAAPEHPVWLSHVSGHMGVANSHALALAGIGRDTPDPPGGRIVRDELGEPTGLLLETAQELIKRVLPPYSPQELKEALSLAGSRMAAEGITAAQDAWAGWIAPQEFRAYQEAVEEGGLPQRVWLLVDARSLQGDYRGAFFGLRTRFGGERLRLGAVKFFADGSLIGRTAALSQPYADPPGALGLLTYEPAVLKEEVRKAHEAGWQVAVHAIGDRAIEITLEAFAEALGPQAPRYRPRVEHAGLLRPDLMEKVRRVGAVVVTQPRFVYELGDGFREALGEERLRWVYPLRSLEGVALAFSSDRPVVEGAPLLGLEAALNRRTALGIPLAPEEAMGLEPALQAYTLGGAYAAFSEGELGSLTVGKWCDFVVLEEDPFLVSPAEIGGIGVWATVVGGRTVFGPRDLGS